MGEDGSEAGHGEAALPLPRLGEQSAGAAAVGEKGRKTPSITRTLSKMVCDMWDGGESSSSSSRYGVPTGDRVGDPSAFKREMGAYASKFLGFDQHDSQEFLQYALEGIHKELNRVAVAKKDRRKMEVNNNEEEEEEREENGKTSANYSSSSSGSEEDNPEAPGITPSESGRRYWRQYLGRDNSLVTDLFLGQFRSTLKCTVCDHESVTFEPFWVVSLPIPTLAGSGLRSTRGEEQQVKLQDCLDLFVKGIVCALPLRAKTRCNCLFFSFSFRGNS